IGQKHPDVNAVSPLTKNYFRMMSHRSIRPECAYASAVIDDLRLTWSIQKILNCAPSLLAEVPRISKGRKDGWPRRSFLTVQATLKSTEF
ncbi:MAG: hypothetical protein AAGL96_17195, partial [Pseudomonadota bacterium]